MTKQDNATVALVGANGQVGTELSFLLRADGFDVVPIVRNTIGAATFDRYDFDYRVGEITDDDHAPRLLEGVDATVILAHVPWFYGSLPKTARKTNRRIVRNSIRDAPAGSKVVLFSSLVAYGDEIGVSDWQFYGREKRNLEEHAERYFERYGREGYIFRLGHVYGPTQEHTQELVRTLSGRAQVRLSVPADKPSNVVHTVTISKALVRTVRGAIPRGTYSIVNRPQWSWSDVIDYYFPDHDFTFAESGGAASNDLGFVDRTVHRLLTAFAPYQNDLLTLLGYSPNRLSSYIMNRELSNQVTRSIESYEGRRRYDNSHFDYEPVPGPYVEVPPAAEILDRERLLEEKLGLRE